MRASTAVVIASVDLSAFPRGHIYHGGVVFEVRARPDTIGSIFINVITTFETRFRQIGGGFTAWTVVASLDTANNTNWDVNTHNFGLAGYHDEFEFCLRYHCTGANPPLTDQ